MKKRVYFFESNIPMGNVIYLPLVSGILQAYAQSFPQVADAYEFMPYIFMRDTPENMIKNVRDPFIMAFSVCIWNHQLSLAVAKLVKQRWPECHIVFGGPQVLADDKTRYDFIDHIVQEEGEKKFAILLSNLISRNINLVGDNLSSYPSPYTLGLYNKILMEYSDFSFQAIVETNRGCPFTCTFCVDANTEITTIYGNKKIGKIEVGDKILGWDEVNNKYIWNEFSKCIEVGKKEVFRVETEDGYVEATRDHKIYTKSGWKEVANLSSSDFVAISYQITANENKQSYEASGCGKETREDIKEKVCERRNNPIHVYRTRTKNNEQNSKEETIWAEQSNARFSYSQENGGNEKKASFRNNFRLYECQKSNEESTVERKSEERIEPSTESKTLCTIFRIEKQTTEFIRDFYYKIFNRTQIAFSLYRRFWIVGWPLCFWDMQESGFCSYQQENQKSNIGSRSILASPKSSTNRIKGLCKSMVGMFYNLGYRQTIRFNGGEDQKIYWSKIKLIRSVGIRSVYDLINVTPSSNFFANGILVHNCYWGQGFEEKKVRHHTLEHVREEAEWIGKNRIKYVFMADANFGMYDRDYEVAKIYCETKEKYGYPEKVRVCYGKNKEENVFRVASLMHQHDLTKAVTLARQSNDETTLKNIRRSNIKLSVYDSLRDKYNEAGIPTYIEIILGMPGETKESFIKGINEIAGTPTQLFVYHCTVLPNTEMFEPEYLKKHGIRTVRVPLAEIHGKYRDPNFVQEYEDIIIETNTMPMTDWVICAVYAWETQLIHVFGVDNIPRWVLDYFYRIAVGITLGEARAQYDPGFGDIYWEPEEMAYLQICLSRGKIQEDPKEFARKNVLWGRKSKVHGKKTMKPQNIIDRQPYVDPVLTEALHLNDR